MQRFVCRGNIVTTECLMAKRVMAILVVLHFVEKASLTIGLIRFGSVSNCFSLKKCNSSPLAAFRFRSTGKSWPGRWRAVCACVCVCGYPIVSVFLIYLLFMKFQRKIFQFLPKEMCRRWWVSDEMSAVYVWVLSLPLGHGVPQWRQCTAKITQTMLMLNGSHMQTNSLWHLTRTRFGSKTSHYQQQ